MRRQSKNPYKKIFRAVTAAFAIAVSLSMAAGSSLTSLAAGSRVGAANAAKSRAESYRLIFDAEYYYNTYPDVQAVIGNDAEALFAHFVNNGVREGRNGCEGFNLRAYVQNNPDLVEVFGDDYGAYCRHYLEFGRNEERICTLPEEGAGTILGTYSSTYDVTQQRAVNVELAAARINGLVLKPGESFSFNQSVLPRTYENGYVLGPSFAGGREVISIGGGICQVSSTLYMAMLHALIPATERYTHSAQVDYVPKGLDATIAGNAKDLKFRNVLGSPIRISAVCEDGVLTVSLQYDFAEENAGI